MPSPQSRPGRGCRPLNALRYSRARDAQRLLVDDERRCAEFGRHLAEQAAADPQVVAIDNSGGGSRDRSGMHILHGRARLAATQYEPQSARRKRHPAETSKPNSILDGGRTGRSGSSIAFPQRAWTPPGVPS